MDEIKKRKSEKDLNKILSTDIRNNMTGMCLDLYAIDFKGCITQDIVLEFEESKKVVTFKVTIER